MRNDKTRIAKSSHNSLVDEDVTLRPLAPEERFVLASGARRWFDAGMPDNTATEYPTWR
jgi:hypothetical protein